MTFTYTPSTDRGSVRLLIPDRVAEEAIFQDDEIDRFLSLEGGVIKAAAALALETISTDEALVQKVMKTVDVSTDGAALAKALMARASDLRDQASYGSADQASFGWAELVTNDFTWRERMRNEVLRDA